MIDINELSDAVIGESIRIHRKLGPGLLEGVYEAVLEVALKRRGLDVRRQVQVAIEYDGLRIPAAFRVDLLVNDYRPD